MLVAKRTEVDGPLSGKHKYEIETDFWRFTMAVTAQQLQQLYVGYLGRAADQAGLDYWFNELNAEGATITLENVRANFVNEQPEYAEAYAGLNRQQTVSQIYQNLFNRTPSDAEVAYWTYSSNVNIDQLIVAFLEAASPVDRLVIDNKVVIAQQITSAYAGSSLEGSELTEALAAADDAYAVEPVIGSDGSVTGYTVGGGDTVYATVNQATNAATAAAAANFGTSFDSADGTALAPNIYGTSATITLNDISDAATLTLANQAGGDLQSLTVNGSVGDGSSATTLTLATTVADTDITTLNLALTSDTTVVVSSLTDLETLDASGSTGDLVLNASALTELTSLSGGSGGDQLTVAAIDTGDTLSVSGGAGNDQITATSGDGQLVIDAGDGNDLISLTAGAATDTDEAYATSITLGGGTDRLNLVSLANLEGTDLALGSGATAQQVADANAALSENMVVVTDFNVSQDVLGLSGASTASFNNIQQGQIANSASLAEALNLVASIMGTDDTANFVYGGDSYVYTDTGDAVGTVDAGDGLLQLVGVNTLLSEGTNLITA
ncbi:hypothetical protein [Stutzerimonas kunmingensis]|uniref:hypothetical protein n=1 Tax=Stutzerimonas kunmingensis TaxID=1211807 RepID=UPI0028972C33|nr:hypothetical protein [Stutzerimonas kunmingensis]